MIHLAYVQKGYSNQPWLLYMPTAKFSVDYAAHSASAQLRASVNMCVADSFCCSTICISGCLCEVDGTQWSFFVAHMTM